jgi:hypothetical protein
MSDLTLNRFLASGTAAERAAFTPDPPTPASGPDPGYVWYETDTGQFYSWDGSAWQQATGSVTGPPAVAQTSFVESGLQVTWDSGLIFRVSAGFYYIEAVRYEFAGGTVTLTAADATNPRIDVIVVNTSSALAKVDGTAAATPSEPSIDPGTQLKLAIVSVPATATQPAAASTQLVYAENAGHAAEWNATASGASIVVNSTNNPRAGTIDIEGTNVVAGVYAQLEKGGAGTVDVNAFDFLRFFIRSKATWNNNRGLQVILLSSGVQKGVAVTLRRTGTYGFDSSTTGSYQQVAIPTGDFQVPQGTTINQIRIQDFGGAIGFYIDDIDLQVVGGTPTVIGGITELTGDVTAGPGSGSKAATIATAAVTLAKMADLAQSTVIGRAAGAGTGVPTALTATQATAILNNVVGDSGAGGTKGLVPAPAAGDAAAAKFLKADATWATPAGAGDVTGPASSTDNAFARFDGAGGKTLQNSTNATLDDSGRALFKALRIPLFDAGNSGTSLTIDWNDGNEQRITLTGDVTLTLNNPGDGGRYVLIFNQDGTGGRTVTWPAAVKWPAGSTPTITSGADKFDLVTLIYLSTEGIYLASINQSYDD